MILLNLYYSHLSTLLITGGVMVAAIGAVRINYKMNMGHQNTEQELMCWAGGILMLLMSGIIVKTLFNQ